MLLLAPTNLPLFLIPTVLVDTSEPPTAKENCNEVFESILSTFLVTTLPASVVICIKSPILNSSSNNVPNPVTVVPLFATEIEPNS